MQHMVNCHNDPQLRCTLQTRQTKSHIIININNNIYIQHNTYTTYIIYHMYIVQYTIQVQYSISSIYNKHQYHIPYIIYIHYTYTFTYTYIHTYIPSYFAYTYTSVKRKIQSDAEEIKSEEDIIERFRSACNETTQLEIEKLYASLTSHCKEIIFNTGLMFKHQFLK